MPEFIFPTNRHEPVDQDGSWQGHKDRHPPSVNPGVDFGCAYGSIVVAAKAGTVNTADPSPSGSGGRVVYIDHDDGSQTQYLHLSRVDVVSGQKVATRQQIALSGGSAFDSDHGVAPHCHVSLYLQGVNSDFMLHASAAGAQDERAAVLEEEEEDMGKFIRLPSGTIGYVGPDGHLTKLNDMDEVRSIEAVGLAKIDEMIQLPDTLIWTKLESISARLGHG
ncbi:M23 family metallopeptidase [Diaminobutyricibacter sp. McL0618]|uniref:M23 family metallopeptidase n=1 Tax=Leifsonia sp. McL0618 TaxID=3415677 RepID=UPI003CF284C3